MLKLDAPAPDFSLQDQDGSPVSLHQFRGKTVVLFFYPKAHTMGCTIEACAFRDAHNFFVQSGAVVLGVSGDAPEENRRFAATHHLPFPLLSDPGDRLRKRYQVARTLGLMPGRATFLIDREGVLRHRFVSQFNPKAHPREALKALEALLRKPAP